MAELVGWRREGMVGWVTIDHPPANALNREVISGLRQALRELEADRQVGAAVIIGAGDRFFVAGADIGEFVSDSVEGTLQKIADGQRLTLEMESSRLPLVAALNGFTLGGGLELAMACDVRIASSAAKVGQPEILLGIIPGWGGTQRLPRLVGRGRALELLLSGDQIDAATALALGLVNRVVEPGDLRTRAGELAARLAERPPLAVAAIKRSVSEGLDRSLEEALGVELNLFEGTFGSADAREGIAAFLAKRKAVWSGS